MKKVITFVTMIANRWAERQLFTITLLILSILTATVLSVNIWFMSRIISMASGDKIDHFTKLPALSCQRLVALV